MSHREDLGDGVLGRILVIDDEAHLVAMIARALQGHGYLVDSAFDGAYGLRLARSGRYELVLLDLRLPDADGVSILRAMTAARPELPVLVLSAMGSVGSKVKCLELGAVDYVSKPFAIAELLARVHARIRRGAAPQDGSLLEAANVTLDLGRRMADAGTGPVALSEREFLVLRHLIGRRGEVCKREQLLEDVWGYTFDPGTNIVDVYVRRLRAKLGRETIETVRNVGYSVRVA